MYEAQIAKGVALLDEKVRGWLDRISLDKLDLDIIDSRRHKDGCGCVLAQTHADFVEGLQAVGLRTADWNDARAYGFHASDHQTLTAEWKATIRRLRAERRSPATVAKD
jgi:hypothetical protein